MSSPKIELLRILCGKYRAQRVVTGCTGYFRVIALGVLLISGAGRAWAAQGIYGRASWGGTLVEHVEIRVYAQKPGTFGPLTGQKPSARAAAKPDGQYRFDLQPGNYVVEAIRKEPPNDGAGPEPGDLYCLFSGSPVTVEAGKTTNVGLYLTKVEKEERKEGETSLRGRLTFKDKPVLKAYLYLYKSADNSFRGPAEVLQPVLNGNFNVRVAPGRYFVLAKKRMKGGAYGPPEPGDLVNFYPLNPVTVAAGEAVSLTVPLGERLNQLDEGENTFKGLKISIVDEKNMPVSGQYIMAYRSSDRTGVPTATSGPSLSDGILYLKAPREAKYLRLRPAVGGPTEPGELSADAELVPGTKEIKLVVRKK